LIENKKLLQTITYKIKLTSLITINSLKFVHLSNINRYKNFKKIKLFLKQSYLLLTWLMYVKGSYSSTEIVHVPSFFVQPISQSKLTNLKTPMAHKTFSQEQFLFKKYILTISFTHLNSSVNSIQSINTSLFMALLLRAETPFFNTNLLFLKRFTVRLNSSDRKFFTLT